MSSARERVLTAIKRNKKPLESSSARTRKTCNAEKNAIPARAQLDGEAMHVEFERRLLASEASLEILASTSDIPLAVSQLLTARRIQGRCFANGTMAKLDWTLVPGIDIGSTVADVTRGVCIAQAFRGIAETGSLVLLSAPGHSSASHFLPELLIVVLLRDDILPNQEAVWAELRQLPEGMPRTVNLVTGPSRTGDIEQKIVLGAHGPKQVHVLIVN